MIALDARVRVRLKNQPPGEPTAIRPYPQALEETVQVAGTELLLRPIRPEDGERMKAFYAKASAQDMRLRFFMARRDVPASELARYSQIDYDREMTFIALSPPDEFGTRRRTNSARAAWSPRCGPCATRTTSAPSSRSRSRGYGKARGWGG